MTITVIIEKLHLNGYFPRTDEHALDTFFTSMKKDIANRLGMEEAYL